MRNKINMDEVLSQVARAEQENRDPRMTVIMREVANANGAAIQPGKISIIEGYPGSACALAVFMDAGGKIECAPIDPLAISFYEYSPTEEEETARREANGPVRAGLEVRGPLELVDSEPDTSTEISRRQLVALQTLVGNNSTWWPITDYSNEEMDEVFGGLELNVIYFNECPVGVAHMDYSGLGSQGAVKIVFIGLDPAAQGMGVGREVLHSIMTEAMERGAKTIFLDTVAHRDLRTKTSGAASGASAAASAHDVYLKAGFKIVDVKLIDPADKAQLEREGLAINQLNGPLEYIAPDLRPLRLAVHEAFSVPVGNRLS